MDLKESHRRLNPATPPSLSELKWYIERPNRQTSVLIGKLRNRTEPLRTLVIGQRGVGKTTELYRLVNEFGSPQPFFLSPDDIRVRNMSEGVAFIAWQLALKANLAKAEVDRAQAVFDRWTSKLVKGTSDDPFRELDKVVKSIRDRGSADPVLLIDNFDRFTVGEGFEFLYQIAKIDCSVVVVVDPRPFLEKKIDPMRNGWEELMFMPAIAVFTPERKPDPRGRQFIASLVEKRVEAGSFDRLALDLISRESGGVPRIALQLAAESCMQAIVQGKNSVGLESARAAVQHYRLKFTHFIPVSEIEVLKKSFIVSHANYDPNWSELLEKQYVFFFQNTDELMSLWFDVHCLLWPILDIKEK